MTIPPQFVPTTLPVPLSPILEDAIGYVPSPQRPPARWLAFYFGAGDEAYYDDGRRGGTGNPWGYLLYVQQIVEPYLLANYGDPFRPYNLGSSDEPASHWLMLEQPGWEPDVCGSHPGCSTNPRRSMGHA